MTLLQCYQEHEGTSVLVPGGGAGNQGQCEQWADLVLNQVYGLSFVYTPAALDWWYSADALGLTEHFDKIPFGEPIVQGDYIIYDGRVGSADGHIDVASENGTVKAFWAYDSNWGGSPFVVNGYPVLHEVFHMDEYNNYIVGYLRLKGSIMNEAQATQLSLYLRLLDFESVEQANSHSADDVSHMLADPGYAGALAKQIYEGVNWQQQSYKASHYDADVAASSNPVTLAPGVYKVS